MFQLEINNNNSYNFDGYKYCNLFMVIMVYLIHFIIKKINLDYTLELGSSVNLGEQPIYAI